RAREPCVRRLVLPGRARPRAILLLMADDTHSLVAPYALDALDEQDGRAFEQHLALCEQCREDLAGLREAAAMLAYGAGRATPPPQAPAGKTYEAWVIRSGRAARAGLFPGTAATSVVEIARPVPPGSVVAVTLERAGGVTQPTSKPLAQSKAT